MSTYQRQPALEIGLGYVACTPLPEGTGGSLAALSMNTSALVELEVVFKSVLTVPGYDRSVCLEPGDRVWVSNDARKALWKVPLNLTWQDQKYRFIRIPGGEIVAFVRA